LIDVAHRRERKQRSRRLATIAFAMALSGATGILLGRSTFWSQEVPIDQPAPSPSLVGQVAPEGQGIWPQVSREEIGQAQDAADAGDPNFAWQAEDGDGGNFPSEHVAGRFAESSLGWGRTTALGGNCVDGVYSEDCSILWTIVRCEVAPIAYPSHYCGSDDGNRFEAVDVVVAQLADQGVGGIWVVTAWRPVDFEQAVPPSREDVGALVDAFLQARIDGGGAEAYLRSLEEKPYLSERYLYRSETGSRYETFAYRLEDPTWPEGNYQVNITLTAVDGSSEMEIVDVGPAEVEEGRIGPILRGWQ
jgi:hypothetical protein